MRLQTEHAATQKAFEETQAERLTLARQNARLAETVGLRDRDLLKQQEVAARGSSAPGKVSTDVDVLPFNVTNRWLWLWDSLFRILVRHSST